MATETEKESQTAAELEALARRFPIAASCAARDELERGDYQAALGILESRLIAQPAGVEDRLGWVECQAHLGNVPVTALNAPLEEVLPQLRENSALHHSALRTFAQVAAKLVARRQLRLAVLVLERTLEFSSGLDTESQRRLAAIALTTAQEELKRAEIKRESKQYITVLKEKIAKLEKSEALRAAPVRPQKERALFTSKAIVEAAAQEDAAALPQPEPAAKHRPFRIGLLFGGAVAVVAGIAWLAFYRRAPADLSARLVNEIQLAHASESLLGAIDFAPLAGGTTLDELRRRLESKPPLEESPAPVAVQVEVSPPPVQSTPVRIEPRLPAKVPEFGADRLRGTRVEDLGTTPREGQGRALDGSPLRAYEVEQFPVPLEYRVIVRTQVMSAPSVVGTRLAELDSDAKVQVVARMGRWLELRSLAGKRGYILAQDAVQLGPAGAPR